MKASNIDDLKLYSIDVNNNKIKESLRYNSQQIDESMLQKSEVPRAESIKEISVISESELDFDLDFKLIIVRDP